MAEETEIEVEESEDGSWNQITVPEDAGIKVEVSDEDVKEVAAEAGITAIIQPGGSIKDDEVITKANKMGIAMAFTGIRHFLH